MDRKRIVFLAVNASYSHSSLAAWTLRSMIDGASWDWRTVEATPHDDPIQVLARVLQHRPCVLAATLYLFNRRYAVPLLKQFRQLAPDCHVVVGGPECLGDNRPLILGERAADAAIRGEGERSLADWLDAIDTPSRWAGIPGFCGRIAGEYHDGGTALPVENLDDIPSFYATELQGFSKPFVQLETSRGCSNGCRFCTSHDSAVRYRSPDRVRADLNAIRAAGIRQVRVVDRTFNARGDRTIRLLRMFRDEFPELGFHLEIDPALVSEAMSAELAQAGRGRFHVEAGIQSLTPEVYRRIGRRGTVDQALAGLRRLCAIPSLAVHADLIAGLPGGTLAGIREAVASLMQMGLDEIQLERLKLLPGTPLAKDRVPGMVASEEAPYEVLRTPDMSFEDLCETDRLSRFLDWFYNVDVLRGTVKQAVETLDGFLDAFQAFLCERHEPSICPGLDKRFRLLDEFLGQRRSELVHGLRYQWFRMGYGTRNGLCPAQAWKGPVPADAALVEGDPSKPVTQQWLVELDAPYLFCSGRGAKGERAVLAVFKLPKVQR
jgi:radical SAM superfamily enzyme YgiQ (UPF0313 family)